jgi:hypothetical protein
MRHVSRPDRDIEDIECPHCTDPLQTESDTVVLEVVDAYRHRASEVVLNVADGYYFEPYIAHKSCWESEGLEAIRRSNADSPPLARDKPALPHCASCLRIFDDDTRVVRVTEGEINVSKTRKDYTFVRNAKPDMYCTECFAPAADSYTDWVEELFEMGT